MSFVSELLYFMGSYAGLIAAFFFGFNFMTKGFFKTYLSVKVSRGKKILIEAIGLSSDYYFAGIYKKSAIHFKDSQKEGHIITDAGKKNIFQKMGVSCIRFDLDSSSIYVDGVSSPGCSSATTDDFLNRIITAPKPDDKTLKIVLFISIFVLLAVLGCIYFNWSIVSMIEGMKTAGVIV